MNLKGALLLFVVALVSLPAPGQFKNFMLEEYKDEDPAACGLTVVINPRYPTNIVAGSRPDRLYYTKDGGKEWKEVKVSSPFGTAGTPAVIADDKGMFYCFSLSDTTVGPDASSGKYDRVVVQRSDDGGASWAQLEAVGFNHPKHQQRQGATIDLRGNLYVTWTQFDRFNTSDSACQSNIFFSMSKNGKKWSQPALISQTSGNCADTDETAEGSMPAVTYDGKVMIAWSSRGKILLDRSFNGGEWWLSNDIAVADQPGGWDLNIPGHDDCNGRPVLMTDNSKSPYRGSLYIVWADQRNGSDDADIWFTRSHNFGDNWSLPMRLNDDAKGKHQYMPWMTVDQATGYIYIVYYDRRNYDDNQTDVYLAYSADGGASFKNMRISENPFTPQEGASFADHISISAHKGIITPVWTRMDEGKTSVWMAVIRQEELGISH